MRYAPYAEELTAIAVMTDGNLMDYFLLRSTETEEIWTVQERGQPFLRSLDGKVVTPVWPYKSFASEAALEYWHDCVPVAVSLEYFVEYTLPQLIEQDVMVDIMPRGEDAGCVITPHRLLDILTGIMSAGEYRLDADG